ncbi:glycerophosphoryl diester phosphodiesterase [Anaerolineae bacterium]|nr:glycerophosphoryl diester phosphodiesterase [Anaerolineae bacterium]
MKKIILLFCALALVACKATTPAPTPTANVSAILTVTAPQKPGSSAAPALAPISSKALIVAHRGGAALMPENTLAAFKNALKLGVDMVETDVHLSKDGEIIIMHDPNVATTTNGSGQISEMTLTELKKLNAATKNAKGGVTQQEIPTLAQVLDTVKAKSGIQIEIKLKAGGARYPGIEKKVIDQVNALGMADKVIIISFDFPTLKEVKAIDPHIQTGAIVDARWFSTRTTLSPDQVVAEIIDTSGADYFMPTSTTVTETLVRAVHARGLKIGTWTVNTAGEMSRLAGWGVDGITTNSPDVLKSVLGR